MAFDLNRSLELIQGGLLKPAPTWAEYAPQRAPWLDTALNIALPAVVVSAVVAALLGWLFDDMYLMFSNRTGIGGLLGNIIMSSISIALLAAIATAFAKFFGGDQVHSNTMQNSPDTPATDATDSGTGAAADLAADELGASQALSLSGSPTFDQGLAAVSFGLLPGIFGNMLGTLPIIGTLLALAAFVYSLVLLYQAFPVFLNLAENDRVKHFIATLLTGMIGMFVLAALLGGLFGSRALEEQRAEDILDRWTENVEERSGAAASSRGFAADRLSGSDNTSGSTSERGGDTDPDYFGIGRQSKYLEDATDDSFNAPSDGLVSEAQVELLIRVLQRTREMRADSQARLEKISERNEGDDSPSLGDIFGGLRSAMDMGTAEMQVVKSAGGNWAEHQWVKEALYEARLQKDLNDRVKANYGLYQEYADELEELL